MHDIAEPRLIVEQGMAARVAAIAAPVLIGLGYRLVRVRVSGTSGCTVQIMAERPDGTMTVEDCEAVSRALSPVFDVEDPIAQRVPAGDFLARDRPAAGAPVGFRALCRPQAKIEMAMRARGPQAVPRRPAGVEGEAARLRREDAADGREAEVLLPIEDMAEAKLVLTDELIAEALRSRGKERAEPTKRRKQARKPKQISRTRRTKTIS